MNDKQKAFLKANRHIMPDIHIECGMGNIFCFDMGSNKGVRYGPYILDERAHLRMASDIDFDLAQTEMRKDLPSKFIHDFIAEKVQVGDKVRINLYKDILDDEWFTVVYIRESLDRRFLLENKAGTWSMVHGTFDNDHDYYFVEADF